MRRKVQLTIPVPCHEKWSSFKPTANGGFCSGCEKDVIDFTNWSEDQLKDYFRNRPAKVCGRFRKEQLKVYTYQKPRSLSGWMSYVIMGIVVLFTSRQVAAQQSSKPKQPTEQFQSEQKTGKIVIRQGDETKVTGVVRDQDGELLPGVNITRKTTGEGVTSDANGKYSITITRAEEFEELIYSFVGFRTQEVSISTNQLAQTYDVTLQYDVTILGGTMTGGISYRWYSPRSLWWRIKSLFR